MSLHSNHKKNKKPTKTTKRNPAQKLKHCMKGQNLNFPTEPDKKKTRHILFGEVTQDCENSVEITAKQEMNISDSIYYQHYNDTNRILARKWE